jgi:hypothetical protein
LPLTFLGIDVEIAGRIFVATVAVLLCLGVLALHRSLFGRVSVVPFVAFAAVYSETFMFGFVNYLLGLALAMLATAHWLRVRDRLGPAIAVAIGWTVVTFFVHLLGALLFLGLVVTLEASEAVLTRAWPRRVRVLAVAAALIVLGALYSATPLAEAAEGQSLLHAIAAALHEIPTRVRRLPHVVDGYRPRLDEASAAVLAIGLAVAALRHKVRVALPMLPALAGLLAVYFIAPSDWAGTSYIPDRLPVPILLLGLASIDVSFATARARTLAAVAVAAVILLRTGTAAEAWHRADRVYAPMLAELDTLPPGSRIYGAVNFRGRNFLNELRLPWEHFGSLASIRRGVFSADVWALPSQNLIVRTPPYEALGRDVPWPNRVDGPAPPLPGRDMLAPALLADADYLLATNPEIYQRPLPPQLTPMLRSGRAVLFHISHDGIATR